MIISSTRHGRRRWWLGGGAAAGVLLAWGVAVLVDHGGDSAAGRHPASPSLHGAGWGPVAAQEPAAPVDGAGAASLPTPMPVTGRIGPVGNWHVQPFRVDARGELRVDATTLKTLEQVTAFNGVDEAVHAVENAARGLPEPARRQALELVRKYGQYESAMRQVVNPEYAPGSVEDMAQQFKALQALRQDEFGQGAHQGLFGEQEVVTARLIQLMQEDGEPHASLEEKAARAQSRLSAERNISGS